LNCGRSPPSAQWRGRANQLSPGHVKWPDIDSIHRATHKARTREPTLPNPEERPSPAAAALDLSFASDRAVAS
jgi:hypothetical protein